MEKTIKIGDKEVRLNNNVGWTMNYRDQFGHDIVPSIMPFFIGGIDIIKGLIEGIEDSDGVDVAGILKAADTDALVDAAIHLSGVEMTDVINITWSLAKTADEDIPEPRIWVKQFETFPLDEIVPEVVALILAGMSSSKNLERLKRAIKDLQPKNSHSTTLSSEGSTED